jgi:hypothetical protein
MDQVRLMKQVEESMVRREGFNEKHAKVSI